MSITDHRRRDPGPAEVDTVQVLLADGRSRGRYRRRWGWAITPGGVDADDADREIALSGFLDVLRERRLRPLFTDLADPSPYARRGLDTHHYADAAVLDLAEPDPASAGDAGLHADLAAAQARLTVLPFRPVHCSVVDALVSCAPAGVVVETFVAVDAAGTVQGVAVWSTQEGGSSKGVCALRLTTTQPTAPAATVELLVADAARRFRGRGIHRLYLGWRSRGPWWPLPATATPQDGHTAAVARFALDWQPRWLALPSTWQLPAASAVLHRVRT